MARQQRGFIVSQVRASIQYLDASGQRHKITKAAQAKAADSRKSHRCTEAQVSGLLMQVMNVCEQFELALEGLQEHLSGCDR